MFGRNIAWNSRNVELEDVITQQRSLVFIAERIRKHNISDPLSFCWQNQSHKKVIFLQLLHFSWAGKFDMEISFAQGTFRAARIEP